MGHDINKARRRRRIPIQLMAERANLSRSTVSKVEKGDPTASMGAYAAVLFALGLTQCLSSLVSPSHDIIGLSLEEERLPKRIRIPKRNSRNHE